MKDFVFTSENGMCPQCTAFGKKYFIQDRLIGGRDYEYALMSYPAGKCETLKFPDKNKLVSWLIKSDVTDDIAANLIIGQHTLHRYSDTFLLEIEERMFVMKESDLSLREYIEPVQETGWFDKYKECLNTAKKLLDEMRTKINGEQLTLF